MNGNGPKKLSILDQLLLEYAQHRIQQQEPLQQKLAALGELGLQREQQVQQQREQTLQQVQFLRLQQQRNNIPQVQKRKGNDDIEREKFKRNKN